MTDDTRSLPYEPALDGVRGLAVVGVLLFHAGHLRGGYLGVDAFFVLSGFLITSLLLREVTTTSTLQFGRFYARRMRRLLPATLVLVAGVSLYAWLVAKPSELHVIRWDGIATLLYFANWRAIIGGRDYWALFRAPSPFEHTWSLAIEEQFYMVWPIVVWLIARLQPVKAAVRVRGFAIVGFAASAAALIVMYDASDSNRVYLGTDTRVASMLLGAVLATVPISTMIRGKARRLLEFVAVLSVAGLAWSWVSVRAADPRLFHGGFALEAFAVVVVLAAVTHPERGILFRLVSFAPLRWVGVVSYGVYLFHWPIFVWLNEQRTGHSRWALVVIRFGVTGFVAVVSYFLIERPIRYGRRARRLKLVLTPVAIGLVISGVIASTTGYIAQAATHPSPDPLPKTTVDTRPLQQRATRLLIVGDSVAFFIGAEGQGRLGRPKPPVVLNRGFIGCRAMRQGIDILEGDTYSRVDGPACVDTGWAQAVETFHPDVTLLFVPDPGSRQYKVDGKYVAGCNAIYRQAYAAILREEIRMLHRHGGRVVVVTVASVGFPFLPVSVFASTRCQNNVARSVSKSEAGAELVDLERWMCPEELVGCVLFKDGVAMRPDLVHYRSRGAQMVLKWILDEAKIQ